jgi:hypothetical protein
MEGNKMPKQKIEDMGLSEQDIEELNKLSEKRSAIIGKYKFAPHYQKIRKESVEINTSDRTDAEKKKALVNLCKRIVDDIEGVE